MKNPQSKNQDEVEWNEGLANEINEYIVQNAIN